MPQAQRVPSVGEDVTTLMPAVGEDVSALMAQTRSTKSPASIVDRLLSLLPTAGGVTGGIVGGIGGTVGGLGVGGFPGAVGGATLGGAFGESVRQLANRARGAETPASESEAAKRIGLAGTVQGGAEALGGLVAKGAIKGAQTVYRGYLKPSLAAKNLGKADTVVRTALDEALPITRAGEAKAGRVIGELRQKVDEVFANSTERIDLKGIADRIRRFARQRYFKPGADLTDYQQALAVADKLDAHPSLGIPPGATTTRVDVPLSVANEAKRALDVSVKESGFGVPTGAKRSAEKFGRRALRVGLEDKAPAVAALNARESKLIDAARAIRRAVERDANQNPLYGVKTLVAGGVGGGSYARGDDPITAVGKGLATRALLTPGAQSWAAIMASRIAKELGVGAASASRLAAYVLSEPEEEP